MPRKPQSHLQRRIRTAKQEIISSAFVKVADFSEKVMMALSPSSKFKNLNFNDPTDENEQHKGDSFHQQPASLKHPHNSHLFRYLTSLPDPHDPQYAESIYNTRVEFPPYPPSTTKCLEKILLKDLILGERNVGTFLVVKAALAPKFFDAVHVLIEDETGRWDLLHIFNFPFLKNLGDRITPGQLMLIKEPQYYVSCDQIPAVRVDHLSDILYVTYDNPHVPEKWQKKDVHGRNSLPKILTYDGEIRMRWKRWNQAIDFFNHALRLITAKSQAPVPVADPALREAVCEVLKFRVGAYFYAGFYELSLKDANIILKTSFNAKAAWYKANILLKNRQLEECRKLILHIMHNASRFKFKECSAMLDQIKTHKRHLSGRYNMRHILERCNEGKNELFAADYVTEMRIKNSTVHGKGMIALRDFKAGELVCAAKAFATVYGKDNFVTEVKDQNGNFVEKKSGHKLVARVLERMACEPKSAGIICRLASDYTEGTALTDEEDNIVFDSFYVNEIVEKNAIQHDLVSHPFPEKCNVIDIASFPPLDDFTDEEGGQNADDSLLYFQDDHGNRDPILKTQHSFWIPTSFINHSCLPNASRAIFSNMVFITATTDIPKGTEVFLNYMGDDYNYKGKDRHTLIEEKFGFDCLCSLCQFERENAEYSVSLQQVPQAINDLLNGSYTDDLLGQLKAVRDCIQILKQDHMDTPDEIPNFEMVYALMAEEWLKRQMDTSIIDEDNIKPFVDMELALNIIQALRGEYRFEDGDIKILNYGFVCKWLVEAYMLAAVSMSRFYGPVYWTLRGAAKMLYGMIAGEDVTFDKVFWARINDGLGPLTEENMQAGDLMIDYLIGEGLDRSELG
ncbi:hypothetical protein AA313_de0204931 [Arthrobotrys entomopaga]|nr:hypothetical protein AA313_de0204931 [Arthrobotrys entomopaga]